MALAGKTTSYEWINNQNGQIHYYHTVLSPLRDEKNQITGVLGVERDITGLKLADQILQNTNTALQSTILERDIALEELRSYQIELEMQNEELRRSQNELDAIQKRYFDLYDLAPVGYCTLNEKGLILETNLTAATMLGVKRANMVNKPLSRFIQKESQGNHYLHHKELFKTGLPQSYDVKIVVNDGLSDIIWANIETTCKVTAEGKSEARVVINNITERRSTLDRLQTSLAEKEILLREVHHRVKNNLASISALIGLQQNSLTDNSARIAFIELGSRIQAMVLVHELLYRSETLTRVDMQLYMENLSSKLRSLYQSSRKIQVIVLAHGVQTDMDTAIPCGLIMTELLTNSFKHAFPNEQPRPGEVNCQITILAEKNDDFYRLSVSDNGIGLPAGLDWQKSPTLGLRLIRMLGQYQLGAEVQVDTSAGTYFELKFSKKDRTKP